MVTESAAAKRRTSTIIVMTVLVLLLALVSLGVGPVRMSPLTVLARISTKGPSPSGSSPDSSSSERASPLTVVQSRWARLPRRTPIATSPDAEFTEKPPEA